MTLSSATKIVIRCIFCLEILDTETKAVRQARLIKNSNLESIVELFSGEGMGSGQVKSFIAVFPRDDQCNAMRSDRKNDSLEPEVAK